MLRYLLTVGLLVASSGLAADKTVKITVEAGKVARQNSPVSVPIELPAGWKDSRVVVKAANGTILPGQLTSPGLLTETDAANSGELRFIVPKLAAGEEAEFTATIGPATGKNKSSPSFVWSDTSQPKATGADAAEQSIELRFENRPVLRYMYTALDESTKEVRSATFKPYHHVYDPAGKRFVTKGAGGLFPHHRGLFFGFNKIFHGPDGKQQADVWHCNNGEYQEHAEILSAEAGPVLGRQQLKINWRGRDQQVFAIERRELTAYNTPGGILIEFASILENPADDVVMLAGDPQHAGFQFRGAQDIPDKTKDQTYYLRPDGRGEPGKFRNWPDNKDHVNLAWNALSFVLDDQRYTCCYLDRPENPKESRFSERDYGRFGSYFEFQLTRDKPLHLNYRVWLQAGEMTVDQVQRLDDDFVQSLLAKAE